jgi:hypothetical protein
MHLKIAELAAFIDTSVKLPHPLFKKLWGEEDNLLD